MEAYSAFHNYSIGNQILALVQCHGRGLEAGPINTFPGWQAVGRIVKRGERALTLYVFTNPDTGTRYTDIRSLSQQRAERQVLPTSRFTIYVTHSVLV
jgi:hypothetical protein